jgi:copper resistance protein C
LKGEKTMKKLLFILISVMVIFPTLASAHTELTSSNPASGQVVTEDVKELVLTYAGEIESLSTMTLLKNGQEVSLSVEPKGKQMIGTLSGPLETGSYMIQWSIAGKDGHMIKGEIPFSVQMGQTVEQKAETKEPVTTENEDSKKEEHNHNIKDNTTKQDNETSSSLIRTIIPVSVVLILGIGLFLLFRRKQ